MIDLLMPIILSIIAGLATGLGAVFGIFKRFSMKYFDLIIGFAAGVMLAVATLGLINEGIILLTIEESTPIIAITIIGGVGLGMLVLLVIDKVLPHLHAYSNNRKKNKQCEERNYVKECKWENKNKWAECPFLEEEGKCKAEPGCHCPYKFEFQRHIEFSGLLLAIGLIIHNTPEGIAMGAGFIATSSLGISLAFAIALHHIPEGFAIAAPLMQANYGRKRIIILTLLAGMAAPLSCIIALFLLEFLPHLVLAFFLCFAAGAMIYITSNDLIPESHKHGYEREATIGVLLGLLLMLFLTIMF